MQIFNEILSAIPKIYSFRRHFEDMLALAPNLQRKHDFTLKLRKREKKECCNWYDKFHGANSPRRIGNSTTNEASTLDAFIIHAGRTSVSKSAFLIPFRLHKTAFPVIRVFPDWSGPGAGRVPNLDLFPFWNLL